MSEHMRAHHEELKEHMATHHGVDEGSPFGDLIDSHDELCDLHEEDHTINGEDGWWAGGRYTGRRHRHN